MKMKFKGIISLLLAYVAISLIPIRQSSSSVLLALIFMLYLSAPVIVVYLLNSKIQIKNLLKSFIRILTSWGAIYIVSILILYILNENYFFINIIDNFVYNTYGETISPNEIFPSSVIYFYASVFINKFSFIPIMGMIFIYQLLSGTSKEYKNSKANKVATNLSTQTI